MAQALAAGDAVIRTPDQRLRVFVSSTLAELAPERAAVQAAIEGLHLIPVLFELGARPHPPRALYRSYLAQSHVFLGIYWQRYGWVAPGEDVSGLEDEYRLSGDLPQLLYIKEPAPEREPRLAELLDRLRADDRASYRTFSTPEQLAALIENDLAVLLTERFEAGAAGRAGGTSETAAFPEVSPAPVPLTATVGRDEDTAAIARLLTAEHVRLLTVTGPGGVGKSRLTLEVARRVRASYPDGVHLVPLEPVTDPAAVLRTIADRLGIIGEGLQPIDDLLATRLAARRMLLIVDNLEHVVEAGPDIAALLERCPGVQVLASSRQPLRLRGEHEYPLAPLTVPADPTSIDAADTSGVELFVQRARAVRPDFALTSDNLAAVAELVRRLDGLPLAIELAAARIRLLSPAALLDRLEQQLDVLSSGALDLPERQRTLRTAIDWSYRLLAPEERLLLDRLSVFAGGASIDAATAVCGGDDVGDVVEGLSSLLEKSLLLSTLTGAEPRVQLLQTVRSYAWERLTERGEAAAIADRHADWFLHRAALVDPLADTDAHARFGDVLQEAEDIRAAMAWVVHVRDATRAAAFAVATWIWFWLSGRIQGQTAWFEQAATLANAPDVSREDRVRLLYALGQVRELVGDAAGCIEVISRALDLARELDDDLIEAACEIALSAALPRLGEREEALRHATRALELGEHLGEPHVIGYASAIRGTALTVAGDLVGARAAQTRTLEVSREVGFHILAAQALTQLALVDTLEERFDDGWDRLAEAATMLPATGSREGLSYWLESAGVTLLSTGDAAGGLRALTAADRIRSDLGLVLWPLMQEPHDGWLTAATAGAGETATAVVGEARRADPWHLMEEILTGREGPPATGPAALA